MQLALAILGALGVALLVYAVSLRGRREDRARLATLEAAAVLARTDVAIAVERIAALERPCRRLHVADLPVAWRRLRDEDESNPVIRG